jgi:hypothetical protein
MYDDDNDIIIVDDDDDDGEDYRNAVVVRRGSRDHRGGGGRGPRIGGPPGRPRPRYLDQPRPRPTVVEERPKRSVSEWVPDVLRGMAAMMPLPVPPAADIDPSKNIANMLLYISATAQVAQRKEQLHTLAAIAERHL